MKIKKYALFLIVIFMVALFIGVVDVNAINTGFQTIDIPIEEKKAFLSNVDIQLINEEPTKKSIACFDVNSNHFIAVGQETLDAEKNKICVYSDEGVFQYGYSFNCSGSFGVEWDEENLNIYFVRSAMIVSVSQTGEILEAVEVQNTVENNSYVNHFIHATERTIDDTEYSIGNDMGILNWIAPSYSQITVKDISGAENIIYDVNSSLLSTTIVVLVIIFVFFSTAIVLVLRRVKEWINSISD